MKSCPQCGATNPDGATFCNLCLTPFGGSPSQFGQALVATGYAPRGASPAYAPPGAPPGMTPFSPSPRGTYTPSATPVGTPTKKLETWQIAIFVLVPVVLVAGALFWSLSRKSPGGVTQIPALKMEVTYPDGWKDITGKSAELKKHGVDETEFLQLPEGRIDVALFSGDEMGVLMFSAKSDTSTTFADLEQLSRSVPQGWKAQTTNQTTTVAGYEALKSQFTVTQGGFLNRQEATVARIVFLTEDRLVILVGAVTNSRSMAEVDSVISSIRSTAA